MKLAPYTRSLKVFFEEYHYELFPYGVIFFAIGIAIYFERDTEPSLSWSIFFLIVLLVILKVCYSFYQVQKDKAFKEELIHQEHLREAERYFEIIEEIALIKSDLSYELSLREKWLSKIEVSKIRYHKITFKRDCTYFLWITCVVFCIGLLGFIRASIETHWNPTYFLKTPLKNITIEGDITMIEPYPNGHNRILLNNLKILSKTSLEVMAPSPLSSLPGPLQKVRVKLKDSSHICIGSKVLCEGTLLPISDPVSPLSYNFKRDYYFKGIQATGVIKNCTITEVKPAPLSALRYFITQTFLQKLSKPYGGIAAALITGEKSGISNEVRMHFVDSGMAHILAISGLHMGLLAGIIFFVIKQLICLLHLTKKLSDTTPISSIAAFFTLIGMSFYLALSGFGFPAIRSFCMTSLIMIGLLVHRNPISMRSIAVAAFCILILFPQSLLSASFALSFAAVIALVAFYEHFNQHKLLKLLEEKYPDLSRFSIKVISYFSVIILTTLIATLATTPLSMAIFNRFTMHAIVANILAIPVTAFWVMPMAIMSTLSLMFGGFESIFWMFEKSLSVLCNIAQWVAGFEGAGILVPSPDKWFYGAFCIGGLLLCLGPIKKIRLLGVATSLISLSNFIFFNKTPQYIGFIAGNRSVMAFYEPPILWVSATQTGSKFHTEQWAQQLAVPPSLVHQIPSQSWRFRNYLIIVDPFKTVIDKSLTTYEAKRKFLNNLFRNTKCSNSSKNKTITSLLNISSSDAPLAQQEISQNTYEGIITNSYYHKNAPSHNKSSSSKCIPPIVSGEALEAYQSAFILNDGSV